MRIDRPPYARLGDPEISRLFACWTVEGPHKQGGMPTVFHRRGNRPRRIFPTFAKPRGTGHGPRMPDRRCTPIFNWQLPAISDAISLFPQPGPNLQKVKCVGANPRLPPGLDEAFAPAHSLQPAAFFSLRVVRGASRASVQATACAGLHVWQTRRVAPSSSILCLAVAMSSA